MMSTECFVPEEIDRYDAAKRTFTVDECCE